MTDRLRQLLDPKPTDGETKRAVTLLRVIKKRPVGVIDKSLIEVAMRYKINDRLALVRETMLECAKVMCGDCASGVRLADLTHDNRAHRHTWDDGSRNDRFCRADAIHVLLAETEDK